MTVKSFCGTCRNYDTCLKNADEIACSDYKAPDKNHNDNTDTAKHIVSGISGSRRFLSLK